jgi:diguanylate cyclase (GGDEF)-like protein
MDFGLATAFYPDESGFQPDVFSNTRPEPDLLTLVQRLHSSLDPRTVFACYCKALGQYLPVVGLSLQMHQHKFSWGKRLGIHFQRHLSYYDESITINYRLGQPLTPSQLSIFKEIEPLLIQPLFNAVKYLDMSQQAMFDSITGLGNRHFYHQDLHSQIARCQRSHEDLSLVLLDLDKFKQLNDNFGHQFGDAVLRHFGQVITSSIRNADQAFRIGGDEFAILTQGNSAAAAIVCQRILDAMATHPTLSQFGVNTSIGVATLQRGQDEACLYETADKALYLAKADGRNCFRVACN